FGFGGTNAHALLEQWRGLVGAGSARPASKPKARCQVEEGGQSPPLPTVVPLSAKTPDALRDAARAWSGALDGSDLPRAASPARRRRAHHDPRLAVAASSLDELRERLRGFAAGEPQAGVVTGKAAAAPKLAFVFAGQGPQWWGMGRQLIEREPVFRDVIRR